MKEFIRNVRDFAPADRHTLERLLGVPLQDNQQLVVRVVNLPVEDEAANPTLPEWCDVYAGLSDGEVADIEKIILTRADLHRPS